MYTKSGRSTLGRGGVCGVLCFALYTLTFSGIQNLVLKCNLIIVSVKFGEWFYTPSYTFNSIIDHLSKG